MKIKVRLLPHWCQVVGYSYWLAFLICCLLIMVVNSVAPYGDFADMIRNVTAPIVNNWEIIGIVNFCMMLMAAFSKERVEDEVMMALRLRSIVSIVVLMFALQVCAYILPDESVAGEFVSEYLLNGILTDFGIFVLIYLVIFKISVVINRWVSRYAE